MVERGKSEDEIEKKIGPVRLFSILDYATASVTSPDITENGRQVGHTMT